jgi:hypothetical protein
MLARKLVPRSPYARVACHEDQLVVAIHVERWLARPIREHELLSVTLVELEGDRLERPTTTRIEPVPSRVAMFEVAKLHHLQDHGVVVPDRVRSDGRGRRGAGDPRERYGHDTKEEGLTTRLRSLPDGTHDRARDDPGRPQRRQPRFRAGPLERHLAW